jgi:PiT family inorganic phosphate transporter
MTLNDETAETSTELFEFGLTQEHDLIAEVYRYMMIGSAMMVCLSHGANDVANAISPLLVAFNLNYVNKNIAYLLGSLGIALGLLLLGHRVMETVGKKVIKLDYPKGFSA